MIKIITTDQMELINLKNQMKKIFIFWNFIKI